MLRGQVTDESGAVVPGSKVTLSDSAGAVRTTTSSNDGSYSFTDLVPGSYTVQASAPGLALRQPAKVSLRTGTLTLNLSLNVVAEKQLVTVEDTNGPTVSTEEACNASAVVLRGSDLDAIR
jgi:hypothetical protein